MMTMKFLNVVYSHCMKPAVVKVSSYYHNRMSAYSVVDLTSTLHRIHGNAKPSAPILQLFVPLLSSTVATALFSTQIFFLWSLQTVDSFRSFNAILSMSLEAVLMLLMNDCTITDCYLDLESLDILSSQQQHPTMSARWFSPSVKLCFPAEASWLCLNTNCMFFSHTALLKSILV